MEANQSRHLPFLEMTSDGITDIRLDRLQVIALSEDRFAESARCESAFRSLFDEKNDLLHAFIVSVARPT
jgi:hypothetical protein